MIRGQDETRGRIERERVVRLATIGGRGRARVALGVFEFDGEVFCSPTDAGQDRSWPGGCATWTGTSGSRFWPAPTTRTGRRCGGSGCAAPAGESPERTHAIGLLEREYQQFAAAPRGGLVAGSSRPISAGPAGRIAGFGPATTVQKNTFGMADRTAAVVRD
jgi:hypothetical protein